MNPKTDVYEQNSFIDNDVEHNTFHQLSQDSRCSVTMNPFLKSIENNRVLSLEGSWIFRQDSLNKRNRRKLFGWKKPLNSRWNSK